MNNVTQRIGRYLRVAYAEVDGWLQRPAVWSLQAVGLFQEKNEIAGDICEIGIHHGKLFLALENTARPGEACIAIDLFENQAHNVDRSGRGDFETFLDNVRKHATDPSRVVVKSFDSTSVESRRFFADRSPVRLFSVDGGHTIQHVMSDLRLAESVLADGGVIFVDDYFNANFPSVTEGLSRYLLGGYSALTPIMSAGGKLLLCGISYHDQYIAHFKKLLKEEAGLRAKTVHLWGHYFWSITAK